MKTDQIASGSEDSVRWRASFVCCLLLLAPAAMQHPRVQLMLCAQRMLCDVCAAALQYIERMKIDILENLRHLAAAPGVQFDEVRIRVAQCYGSSSTPS